MSIPTPRKHHTGPWRRIAAAAVAVVAGAGLAVVGPSQPASAAFTGLENVSSAYTDLRTPRDIQRDPGGDLPVGAWRDDLGRLHVSRAYLSFDLSVLAGRHVYSADLLLSETAATTCDDRRLELWATGEVTEDTSWLDPPARFARLEPGEGHGPAPCPAPFITWSATGALRGALAAGATTFTVEALLPGRYGFDPGLGRRLSGQAQLFVEYETLPLPRPEVFSSDYPEDPADPVFGAGIPGEFSFDAQGVEEMVGFQYVWNDVFGVGDPFTSPGFVWADQPGGSATVTLAPPRAFQNNLFVRGVRADGLTGAVRDYKIIIRDTAPLVTWDPAQVQAGVPFPITFTPALDGMVEYRYRIEDLVTGEVGPELTVPANPDGTGTALVTLPEPGPYLIVARNVHADGWTSPESRFLLFVS
jgi:hypothetical protein